MSRTTFIGKRSHPRARDVWPPSTPTATSRPWMWRIIPRLMRSRIHTSIDELDPPQWNALGGDRNPFLRQEFLAALAHTGCVGAGTGWEPAYPTLWDDPGPAPPPPALSNPPSLRP